MYYRPKITFFDKYKKCSAGPGREYQASLPLPINYLHSKTLIP